MGGKPLARRQRPDVTPRLLPAWAAIAIAGVVAVVGAISVYLLLTVLLDLPRDLSGDKKEKLEQRKLLVEAFKAALGLAVGLGAVVALALNYRRHRIEESQSHRDDQRLFTDRFQSAAEQLGHEQPAVRLAGVHAMARLADDWDEQRQTCVDVLCAYVRLPPTTRPESAVPAGDTAASPDSNTNEPPPATPPEEREVRQTIVRLITDHLRVDATDTTRVSWQGHNFDFTGVVFDGGTLGFQDATFSGGEVSFDGATFSGRRVSFDRATFSGGEVSFDGATFSGGQVSFYGAKFSDGHVSFLGATFSGGEFGFYRAKFSGGEVSFNSATFAGGQVSFDEATFAGGEVSFDGATFSGGEVSFDGATFSGGQVSFYEATFSGGQVGFVRATYSGGRVTFREIKGGHPPVFDSWEAVPSGLVLPPDWLAAAGGEDPGAAT